MNEPEFIPYNRQVGQSVYLIWLVEAGDLGAIMGGLCLNMMVVESYWLFLWTLVAYFIYVLVLRAGRPRGYDRHFFASLSAPKYLRPGRSDAHQYIRRGESP